MSLDADVIVDRRKLRRKLTFWRVLTLLLIVGGGAAAAVLFASEGIPWRGGHIARFTLSGFIGGTRHEVKTLDRIADSRNARALIVRIDSPGGTTAGSEALYDALRRVAAKKPVVAVVNTLAASGAYIAALGTDRIVVRRNALIGSVGVLYQWPEVSELLESLGVNIYEVKSAPLKAAPNYFEPPTAEARAVVEDLVRDAYGWFIGLVAERRGLDPQQTELVGNGRVFTGHQAMGLKLVDQIGGEDDAIAWLAASRGIAKDLPVRDWKPRGDGFGVEDLATRAISGALQRIGLGALASLFDPAVNPLARTGSLDGLLSVWHASRTGPGRQAPRAAP